MRSAILVGRDHRQIGALELVAEGPCAVALSRGGAAKTYNHTDPNEDACLFASGPGGVLIAVADGHSGEIGAAVSVEWLLQTRAEAWTSEAPRDKGELLADFSAVLVEINAKIRSAAEGFGLPPAPTTLSFVLIRPADEYLAHASVGDSHTYYSRPGDVCDFGWAADRREAPHYLGDLPDAAADMRCEVAAQALGDLESVVLVTDGFSEQGIGLAQPLATLEEIVAAHRPEAPDRRATEICRATCDAALASQRKNRAGDNIACAVWVAAKID